MDVKRRVLRLNRNPNPDSNILPFSFTIEAKPYATQLSRTKPFNFLAKISLRVLLDLVYL